LNGRIVTLTTDFGTRDPYVGAMKGVLYRIDANIEVVDITHEIGAQDVMEAALTLAASCPWYPAGTVHTAVVDPGVGGARRAVALRTKDFFLVGPDNGIFSLLLRRDALIEARAIRNEALMLHPVSATFHGRDIFAPVAGYLAAGGDLRKVGPKIRKLVGLDLAEPGRKRGKIVAQAIHVDRFGNVVTNLGQRVLEKFCDASACRIEAGSFTIEGVHRTYSDVEKGEPLALFGSTGMLEISVNEGRADERLGIIVGDSLEIMKPKNTLKGRR